MLPMPHDGRAADESIWRSPLVPVALALTAGVVLDRLADVPFAFSLLVAALASVAFLAARLGNWAHVAPAYLLLAVAALGAAHHQRRHLVADDDIARDAAEAPRPVVLRGTLAEEPRRLPARHDRPALHSQPAAETAAFAVHANALIFPTESRPVSGRVRVFVSRPPRPHQPELLAGLHPGDIVEVRGQLRLRQGPSNPGEFDALQYGLDQGARALLSVRQGDDGVRLIERRWPHSPRGWLGWLRAACHRRLSAALGEATREEAVARALLLGDGAPMTRDDWARYVRTGVVHVLAISGQHLVIVAAVMWWLCRVAGARQRPAAIVIALALLAYALLTGGRPPALRAAVGACVLCGALVLRRPALPANLFALAWVVIVALNPGDLFDAGCQLSFLAVAALCWLVPRFFPEAEDDPLGRLIDRARPAAMRWARWGALEVAKAYAVCALVWLAVTPLAGHHAGTLAPAALLLGPPLTALVSLALVAGLLLLVLGDFGVGLAWLVRLCLWACDGLVGWVDGWGWHVHAGAVPAWWVAPVYLAALALLGSAWLRRQWRWAAPAGAAWACVLLLVGARPPAAAEMRLTFVAVGHGGCAVLEAPDGRVLVYDAGAMRGPDVTRSVIAPYLWARRVKRVDDIVLSHADLDHHNGLSDLLDRFAAGRVLHGETFAERESPGVRETMRAVEGRRVRAEAVAAGDRLALGDVAIDVLHPPRGFRPPGENARSLVLLVRHGANTVLLTGDLEREGLAELLRRPGPEVDVLQAPHHGSARLDVAGLLRWCRPRLVVSCQGAPRSEGARAAYERAAPLWTTHDHGAVTLRSSAAGLAVEAFRTGKRVTLR